jgi:hypothetical protein
MYLTQEISMSRRSVFSLLLFLGSACVINLATAQVSAAPAGPLTCHKQVCPQPTSACQVLESQTCLKGGGPPRCPAIITAPNGTSCSDGNICTSGDVCNAGVCGGSPVLCSGPTDTCTQGAGCATQCGPAGCIVGAVGGFLNPTLTVPPGSLIAPVAISMVDQGGDPNDTSVFHVYSFTPAGTQFSPPATVDLPAPPFSAGHTAIIEVSDDSVTWTAIATTINNGRVSGPIAHFSHCRTRDVVQGTANGHITVVDAVDYQNLVNIRGDGLVIPPVGEAGSCYSGDLSGICIKIHNQNPSAAYTSSCPVPTPTPPPAGCEQLHVVPWQCYTTFSNFPGPFDPANPTAYEGEHCDITGLVIPCAEIVYNMDQFLPAGGVPISSDMWIDLNFLSAIAANGGNPFSCFGSSLVGFDLIFREPTPTDNQGGIRSAKDGPFIQLPSGARVTWEQLVAPQPANYPTLRFGTTGTAFKNWLQDQRF